MQIGTSKISAEQRELLSDAMRNVSQDAKGSIQPERAIHSLYRVMRILGKDEELLPDWLSLYEIAKPLLSHAGIPADIAKEMANFFGALAPFDSQLASIDPKGQHVAFLLGAGASKPKPSDIPTVKELLPHLLDRARRLDRDDVTKLSDFCEEREINNIEDLLTAAQLATFCSRNPIVLRLVNYLLYREEGEENLWRSSRGPNADLSSVVFLQDTLQTLFGLLSSTMLPAKPNAAHKAIARYAKEHPGTSIITTNYDCCMDLALGDVNKDFIYQIDFANVKSPHVSTEMCAKLIKLHGSLNWYYCETCQEVQSIDIQQMVNNFLEDRAPYPVIGICKDCGGQRRGLLVPPLAMKFDLAPPLTPLVSQASESFKDAELIVVVGFSFAEADLYISRLLNKSMQEKESQKLLVVDPDRQVAQKVQRKFKASIPNFDTSRILTIAGDCADTLGSVGKLILSPVAGSVG